MTQFQEDAALQAARATPAGLAYYASRGTWRLRPHLRVLDTALHRAITGEAPRVIVTMPPRHGKSMLASQYSTAWAVGNDPHRSVLLASYEASFAAGWGMKARDALAEIGPHVFGVRLHPDVAGRDNWKVQRFDGRAWQSTEGGMSTAGVGGALTGKGAHLLVIDDPIKNWEEAQSLHQRDKVWDWYNSVAYTRLEPNGAIVCIMTRWHEDDLVGRLLAHQEEEGLDTDEPQWQVINMPAIAEPKPHAPDPLGREKGEALWPQRFNQVRLKSIERQIGSMMFACLYQQRPAPEGGTVFFRKHFQYWSKQGDEAILWREDKEWKRYHLPFLGRRNYVDPALTDKQVNDPTVIMVIYETPDGEVLVDDIKVERAEAPDVKNLIRNTASETSAMRVGVEDVAYQASIVQELLREGYPIVGIAAEGNKYQRAVTASTRLQQGRVYFKRGAPWIDEFERELLYFPNATHDDQVDTLAYALIDTLGRSTLTPVVVVNREPGEDNVLVVNF